MYCDKVVCSFFFCFSSPGLLFFFFNLYLVIIVVLLNILFVNSGARNSLNQERTFGETGVGADLGVL